jgi:uncharacterized protein (TIGR01777 family)
MMLEAGMKVLITGGSGLIGRALTEKLIQSGHEVIVLSRIPNKVVGMPDGVKIEAWDGKTTAGWGPLVSEVDAVVNLAGASIAGESLIPMRWTEKRKALIYESRINAGKALVEAVAQAERKPKVLIQASAIGYYGFHDEEELDENSLPGADFLAMLSINWEASTQPVTKQGVRHAVIRTGLVLSNQGGVLPLFKLQFGLFVGGRLGSGKQYYSWIHIEDQVGGIIHLIENGEASGAFNLTAPEPVTNQQFVKTLGRVMKRPAWLPVPEFALRLALGEVAGLSVNGQRVLPRRLLETGFEFKFPGLKTAFSDLLIN